MPVELTHDEVAVYYERISNAVLWPLCHDRLDMLPLRVSGWEHVEAVNARFADAVAAHYRPGDLVWCTAASGWSKSPVRVITILRL